jgi:hypothetical protein
VKEIAHADPKRLRADLRLSAADADDPAVAAELERIVSWVSVAWC